MNKTLIAILASIALFFLSGCNDKSELQEAEAAYKSKDYAGALSKFSALAEKGNIDAQVKVADIYAFAEGVPQDNKKAFSLYTSAAEKGNASAQNSLGYFYINGLGGTQNHEQAMSWFKKSAQQNNSWAKLNLAAIYGYGLGAPQNQEESMKYLQSAADDGNPKAQQILAAELLNKNRDAATQKEAFELLKKSASQGLGAAYALLADFAGDNDHLLQAFALVAFSKDDLLGKPKHHFLGNDRTHTEEFIQQILATKKQLAKEFEQFDSDKKDKINQLVKELSQADQVGKVLDREIKIAETQSPTTENNGSCIPTGNTRQCSSQCRNGDCIVTYSNGCKVRVQVQPQIDPFTSQLSFPSPSC
ncbi:MULTISPECIES: tetratricopeptide repeat protein [Deefgea]|uniref:Sel1 repeat family protein n=1 Tax=Deefgea chitinilytica TaxID=570276 RepID=A0ABS2CE83_9NEIS|nr:MULTISPECIES: tetratricopeptide repeat protein [Deefgea]MBM5572317.1 hypothetical protein [Deefgea chitinilytica]MBM9889553.1 sel1 repeat family protein [Deefgea sp. CFH1-16]